MYVVMFELLKHNGDKAEWHIQFKTIISIKLECKGCATNLQTLKSKIIKQNLNYSFFVILACYLLNINT